MKKTKILLCLAVMFFGMVSKAQEDTLEKRFLLNFVIPDMPAYKSLGIEKSNLLRPSDVKEFALMLSPFYSNGKPSLPKNFGLEFAPWKMASRKWTLSDYNKQGLKRFLYSSSFSLATANDSTPYPSKISIGYRFAFLSKEADLIRIAFSNQSDFAQKADEARLLKTKFEVYWLTKVVKPMPPPSERDDYFQNHQKEFYSFLASINPESSALPDELKILVYDTKRLFGDDFDFKEFETINLEDAREALIQKIVTKYKNENWNANRIDAALAWVGKSKDSAISEARFSSFNAWLTGAFKLGRKGQWLIGGNIKLPNSAVDSSQNTPVVFVGSTRVLLGNSNFRFFGEAQWESINYGNIKNTVLLNLGGEIRISDKFWVVASSGLENLKDRTKGAWYNRIVANLDVRYGFNF